MTNYFNEVAIGSPSNRGYFMASQTAINLPFKKDNRFSEFWRGMFLTKNDQPTEKDFLLGNFYLECDIEDFRENRNVMLDAADVLMKDYGISTLNIEFFRTNRSNWLVIPAKVFGCFGSVKLNLIYKAMATQIQNKLNEKGYNNPLDLSIYKWNGLIHSLGSFLPKVNRWVTKFNLSDLEEAVCEQDVLNAKFDNSFTYEDFEVVEKAQVWYQQTRNMVLFHTEKTVEKPKKSKTMKCMEKLASLARKGEIEVDRNNHIYSYALYLKNQGYDTNQAITEIEDVFQIPYSSSREAKRTVKSAIEGSKHLNYRVIRQILNPEIFEAEEDIEMSEKETFIFPRLFIELLQQGNAHYDTYKYLMNVLYAKQIMKKDYTYDLTGEKHKYLIIKRFEKLSELNIANVEFINNQISVSLISKEHAVYKSHIVIPNKFLNDKRLLNMKNEIKVLFELWRASILSGNKQNMLSFNVKTENLKKTLKMQVSTLMKSLSILKKLNLVFANRLFIFLNKKEVKTQIKKMVLKRKPLKAKYVPNENLTTIKELMSTDLVTKVLPVKNIIGLLSIV